MMKKITLATLLLCAALLLTACADTDIGQYYQRAQLYLGCGDYAYAAELFEQLGEYEAAADYALYARALQAIEEEKYDLARANLTAINPFKSSGRFLMLLDAQEAEEEGKLEDALKLYEKLGTFAGADTEAARLRKAIPEAAVKEGRDLMAKGDYEAARALFLSLDGYGASKTLADNCTAAMNKIAYNAADDLYRAGDLLEAMEAFTALGDSLDAAKRAADIRDAIHAELDARYTAVTLATAPELMEAYAALEGDPVAAERADELAKRFGKNLELITMEQPVLRFGEYPYAESGEGRGVMWRVIRQEGAVLTLLSEHVLDASAEAVPAAVTFAETELAAAGELQLPAMADLAGCTDQPCDATPYALAQGAERPAAYWLRDCLENGLHPVISASGALTLPEEGSTPGIRLMMTLDLEKFTFANGSGTLEDPFCAE